MDDLSDKYGPLSEDELIAGAQEGSLAQGAREATPVSPPADAEPPEAAASRLFGRAPDALWRYANAEGELAFCICRWNKPDGDKDVLPLSWFAGEGWRFGHWPAPRPLYCLDALARRSDTPIVICEGEKAAGAAAKIFPQSVVTTSSGGSGAAAKTDWTPLFGRRALIWPDADEPGAKYAAEVAAILATLDCEIRIIDAKALAKINPAGGEREPKAKWDAADAIEEWLDLQALCKTAVNLAKPFDPGPLYVSFDRFEMSARGLTVEVENGRGDNKTTEKVWICAPFEILGACRDPHGRGWGKLLRWRDADGRSHLRHVPDADLQVEPAALCAILAGDGLRINPSEQRRLRAYLSVANVKGRVTIVNRTGWQEIGGKPVFVLPNETIGPHGAEKVILDAAAHGPYEAHGSVEDWQKGVGALASGHKLAVLAISAALAGVLLSLAGQEGGGIHFYGQSSRGKTTLLQMAASVWGRGDSSPGFVRAWRATANGLEGAAAGASDTALILDELAQIEAREAAMAVYSLSNGGGKVRAARNGDLREPKSWRLMFISSGEVQIEAKLTEDRARKARAGQLVRMIDIAADRGKGFGVFDHAGPDGDAAALAKACKQAAIAAYGTAGPEFLRRLIDNGVTAEEVREAVSAFLADNLPEGADGQIDRAAHRLGLIAAAGDLATTLGIVPWRANEAQDAAAWALREWIKARGGTESAETRQAIEQVRLCIEQHGESRFQSLDDSDAKPVNNRLGWRKGGEWWVLPGPWKSEICHGLDAQFVARVLAERGMLRRQDDRNLQRVVKVTGSPLKVYVLTVAVLEGGEHG